MSLSPWNDGSDPDQVTGLDFGIEGLVGRRKILALQMAKLPRYWREGAVEVRPFPAKKRRDVSEAQGLSNEAMKGNPLTTVILRVDESKPSLSTETRQNHKNGLYMCAPVHVPWLYHVIGYWDVLQ
jgi:hypothetical protein